MVNVRFMVLRKGPRPRFYRLWIIGLGVVGEAEDWQLLRMIAAELYPQQFMTIYAVF
jgi:hypothetical protein